MPIVDGLTSTKMIRSLEKTSPNHVLSQRASLNGRIPVIAVSASLIEKERQIYIDAGFDGWILKPISFPRLTEIMSGIVDPGTRKDNLYRSGNWERGGWFKDAQPDVFAAHTSPNADKQPMSAPSEGVKIAAVSDDPQVKEDEGSRQTEEQQRMATDQEIERQEEGTLEDEAVPPITESPAGEKDEEDEEEEEAST